MPRFAKHFTLPEARALLPQLRQLFAQLHRARDTARQADDQLGAQLERCGGDVGAPLVGQLVAHIAAVHDGVRQLQDLGVVVKDFDRGLVDFPSLRDGREVFLCWELDEEDIEFWHELDAGYAGRERL